MAYLIYIVGAVAPPYHTQWDGQYLVDYAPGEGYPGAMLLHTSPNIAEAERFVDVPSALREVLRVDPSYPWRTDAKPNTPLIRFVTQIVDERGQPVQPPTLSNVVVTINFQSSVVVSWQTSEPCVGVVNFGPSPDYGSSLTDTTTPPTATGGTVSIPGAALLSGQTYHLQVTVASRATTLRTFSPDQTFVWTTSAPLVADWRWNNQAPPPINGQLRTNSRDWVNATHLFIANQTDAGQDVSASLKRIVVGSSLDLTQKIDPSRSVRYTVKAAPIAQSGYVDVGVACVQSTGTLPNSNSVCALSMSVAPSGLAMPTTFMQPIDPIILNPEP